MEKHRQLCFHERLTSAKRGNGIVGFLLREREVTMEQYGGIPWGCFVLISLLGLVVALLAEVLLAESWDITLSRVGLFLQLIATLSVLPEIIGGHQLRHWPTG